MIKVKKLDDTTFLHSDAETGEPVAISKKSGSGKFAMYSAKWHPHIIQTIPEAKHILSRPTVGKTTDNMNYNIDVKYNQLQEGKKHDFDIEKDPEQINVKIPYSDETVPHNLYHIIDKGTGNKILTLRHRSNINQSHLGTGEEYKDILSLHAQHIGTPENLEVSKKKSSVRAEGFLHSWVNVAENLKKTVATGGPRFVGHTADLTGKSKKKTYKTTIQDPTAAINDYVKVAIPGHEKLTKTVITPSMQLLHGEDEHHIIKYNNGKLTHIEAKQTGYSETAHNQVFENFVLIQ